VDQARYWLQDVQKMASSSFARPQLPQLIIGRPIRHIWPGIDHNQLRGVASPASPGEVAAIEDVCTACGERNPAGSAFCLYCGVYLGWDEAGTAEAPSARRSVPAGEGAVASSEAPTRSDPTLRQPGVHAEPGDNYAPTGQRTGTAQHGMAQNGPGQGGEDWPEHRAKPGELSCPQCGQANAATLRFCSKCGRALRPSQPTTRAASASSNQTAWQRFWDPGDRRARRDYRRSLPLFYRWRRVIIGVGTIVAVLVILSVAGKDPVSWAKGKYYDIRGTLVLADPVAYAGDPPQSVAKGYDVAALGSAAVDDAWATPWSAEAAAPLDGCDGKTAAKGMVHLSFEEAIRVRRLDVLAGLPPTDAKRPLQFRPSVLLVMYDGRCSELPLKDSSEIQRLVLDTGVPVKDLIVAIGSTYPARADAAQPLTALTSLAVLSRPH
jgi:hypothetical protein